MTTTETLKLALEALETGGWNKTTAAITALREALAEQPAPVAKPHEQEPVAVVSGYYGGQCVILPIDPARIFNSNTALYTAPQPCPTCEALARTVMLDQTAHDAQRKPWVGLTDEEIDQGLLRSDYAFKTAEAWRAGVVFAMTKLKEKNT